MQSQKLCLKWNNHTTNLLTVLGSFRQKDHLVDVTISCEGQNIKAHKMILSACSPYFEDIFQQNPCQHPIIIMNGMRYDDITAILNFAYKGEVNVSQDGLTSFLQAAEALKIKGLAEVCGEKSNTNSINKEINQSDLNRPQRTDTPPRKRHRNRKRSLSDSNRSDDEGNSRKQHREPTSPEIQELSGDESFTGDNSSNGPPFNSTPRVPQTVYSRSHQSSSNMGGEEDDFEVEPSKMLEQSLTTEPASNSNSDNNLRIERIIGNATEIESSSLQEPESPPDIKPVIDFGESSAGPSESTMMLYNEQSQPGPSNMQDGSLIHDNSHAQGLFSKSSTQTRRTISTHTCETTQLLQELKDDSICLCQLNNSDFVEVLNQNEPSSAQTNSAKSSDKSKQLIIFNEKGCMKGIEVNKDIKSNETSDFAGFQFANDPMLETYILVETDESCDYFNSGPAGGNISDYETKWKTNITDSDGETLMGMPTSYTQSAAPTTRKKKRRRGRPKGSLNKKTQQKRSTSVINIQTSPSNQSGPYTSTLKKSYTKVSVQEVHVTKAQNPVGRPRRNTKNKTASEMLMLKRKIRKRIVQSTSIAYKPSEIHRNYTNTDTTIVAKPAKGRQIVRMPPPDKLEKYGPHLLPSGWNVQVITRKSGKTAGQIDIYFVTPDGKRLRSRSDLASYIEKNSLPLLVDDFCFRKGAYTVPMLKNSTV